MIDQIVVSLLQVLESILSYISQLLLTNDCVIIPNFGGFVANPKPAQLVPTLNKLIPPSKEISFNKNLRQNDGLLADFISREERISYKEAINQIEGAVDQLKAMLKADQQINIPQIGLLYSKQDTLLFEPLVHGDNLLLQAYGLESLFAKPLLKDKETSPKINQVVEVKKEPAKVVSIAASTRLVGRSKVRKLERVLSYVGAACIAPLFIYIAWLLLNINTFSSRNFTYADLNPIGDKVCALYTPRLVTKEILTEESMAFMPLLYEKKQADVVALSLADGQEGDTHRKIWVKMREPNRTKIISTRVANSDIISSEKQLYHLIAGCFMQYNNAERLVNKFRSLGYQNATIVDRKNGLYRVSVDGFNNEVEARQQLIELNNSGVSSWLLAKK